MTAALPGRAGGMTPREALVLLSILALTLLPLKNMQMLQFAALLHFLLIAAAIGRLRRDFALFALGYLAVLVTINLVSGHIALEVLKPLWGLSALLVAFSMERRFGPRFYARLVEVSFALMAAFFLLQLAGLTRINELFRVTAQYDVIHETRLTAPFLFAGDYGLVCLFLGLLALSFRTPRFTLIAAGFLVLLLFTQSRLALAGLPFLVLFARGARHALLVAAAGLAAAVALWLNLERIHELFPYVFRFFDMFDFYLSESKRAEEFRFVFGNLPRIVFRGTEDFVLTGNLDTAESSVISYAVKSGVFFAALFWGAAFAFGARYLAHGGRLIAVLLFFSLFAAPLDRPKSSVFLAVALAGISCLQRRGDPARGPPPGHSPLAMSPH